MEALKDVFPRRFRDGTARVTDRDDGPFTLLAAGNPNPTIRTIIFPRILEEILQDQDHVVFLTGDLHVGTITFNLGIHTIGQCAQVIHLGFQEMGEIHRSEGNLKASSVHL